MRPFVTSEAEARAGDVVVVPFPYVDQLAEKRRPALIVSGSDVHAHGFVWVAMITSSQRDRWPGDVVIEDLTAAGLPSASVVRTLKITTIEASRIIRIAGRLTEPTWAAARLAVRDRLA
jgi:mRNA interferase MazF